MTTEGNQAGIGWQELLNEAVSKPGIISEAYNAFHGYSVGNQMMAAFQCMARGIACGPMATFPGWKEKGRYVKKGEKALFLWQPVTGKRTDRKVDQATGQATETQITFTRFICKPRWFVISQTEGHEMAAQVIPEWDAARAMAGLGITESAYEMMDGNCQGYAKERSITVSPVAVLPHKTRFHEMAHVVMGHTVEHETIVADDERTPRSVREVEAECVALICCEALGLAGSEEARGYIQAWNGERGSINEKSAQRIFKAADAILRAGRGETGKEQAL